MFTTLSILKHATLQLRELSAPSKGPQRSSKGFRTIRVIWSLPNISDHIWAQLMKPSIRKIFRGLPTPSAIPWELTSLRTQRGGGCVTNPLCVCRFGTLTWKITRHPEIPKLRHYAMYAKREGEREREIERDTCIYIYIYTHDVHICTHIHIHVCTHIYIHMNWCNL